MDKFRNKKTIVAGEVNTGKTGYLEKILSRFLEDGETGITVIDLAPERVKGVGGKMNMQDVHAVKYVTTEIVPPRIMGNTEEEVEALARRNAALIEVLFRGYVEKPDSVLFINDISLYLQAGDLDKLLSWLETTPTVIMNGYLGSSLGGGTFGDREQRNMEALLAKCDKVLKL